MYNIFTDKLLNNMTHFDSLRQYGSMIAIHSCLIRAGYREIPFLPANINRSITDGQILRHTHIAVSQG